MDPMRSVPGPEKEPGDDERGFVVFFTGLSGSGKSTLAQALNDLVLEAGGRIYLAKDGRTRPEALRRMYPALGDWLAVRRAVDPRGVLVSDLSRRLAL
jgi:decaprenylphospho-beta-D-ribofuranose 2-oxidase